MRKMGLWRFCFGSGLDTACLALPPFLGRLWGLPAMGIWRSETWHTQLFAWPSFIGHFCLGSSLLPDIQGLRVSISSPLSLVCWAQKLFVYALFVSPPYSSTLPYLSRDVGGDASFHSGLVIHPFPLFCLTHVCELLEGFRQSRLRLASCSLVGGCFLFLPFSLAPFCILYPTDCGAGWLTCHSYSLEIRVF